MTDEFIKQKGPSKIQLLDGKEFDIPPLNLLVMYSIEKEFGCKLSSLAEQVELQEAGTIIRLLMVLVKYYLPDITIQDLGPLVDTRNLESVSNRLAEILSSEE